MRTKRELYHTEARAYPELRGIIHRAGGNPHLALLFTGTLRGSDKPLAEHEVPEHIERLCALYREAREEHLADPSTVIVDGYSTAEGLK